MTEREPLPSRLNSLPHDTAAHVHGLLEEACGGFYDGFESYMTDDLPWHEWRFQGTLGFGGKLHLSFGRLYVSCYPEDWNEERHGLIERVNAQLAEVVANVAA